MRRVQQANEWPHHCAVLPFIGNSNASGWIDTGSHLDRDAKVYVSFEAIAEMAKQIGWVPRSHVHVHEQENASLKARIAHLEAELQEAESQLTAIDYLSKHGQMKAYAKAGRPKKDVKEVTT